MAEHEDRNYHQSLAVRRKRGRPSGHKRLPMRLEERRAQNAQYERERREEERAAFAELAEALSCQASTSKVQVLLSALEYIQTSTDKKYSDRRSPEDIRRQNENLERQIKLLKQRGEFMESDDRNMSSLK